MSLKPIRLLIVISMLAGLLLAVNITSATAAADTCTWTGATDNDITDASNWTGCDNGNAPETGDTLVFPESASNKNILINSFAVSPASLQFTGTGYSVDTTNDTELTFSSSGTVIQADEDVTFNVIINLGTGALANMTIRAANGATISLTDDVVLDTGIGEINIGGTGYEGTVDISGPISGSTSQFIAVSGATADISGNNTFTAATVGAEGNTTDGRGVFQCNSTTCFGDSANDIYMGGGLVEILVSATFNNGITTSTTTPADSELIVYDDISITDGTTVNDDLEISQQGPATSSLQLLGGITLNGNLAATGVHPMNSEINLNTNISGTGDLTVADTYLEVTGGNTFTGDITVQEDALLSVQNATGLGNSANEVTVENGGTVSFSDLAASVTVANPFVIEGEGEVNGAITLSSDATYLTLTGNIELTGNAFIGIDDLCATQHSLILNGVISGTGDLTVFTNIPCTVSVGGASPNTFDGDITVTSGYLSLSKNLAAPNNAILDPDDSTASTTIGVSDDGNVIGGGAVSTADESGEYFYFLGSETLTSFEAAAGGYVLMCPGETLTIDQDSDTTFDAFINNSGTCLPSPTGTHFVVKQGTGTLTVDSDDPSDDETVFEVQEGELVLNGERSLTGVAVTGGTLKGDLDISDVAGNSGRINVGNSPGCGITNNVVLSPSMSFDVEIESATVCTGYDQLGAGDVDLAGASLTLNLGYAPAIGTVFTIIDGASVTGTFASLPEGTVFTNGGSYFRISYAGGDVTLTAVDASQLTTGGSGTLPMTGITIISSLLTALSLMAVGFYLFRKRTQLLVK